MNFQQSLLEWYGQNKRDLIFRKDKDPYKIWISEIMSQQTRIETLIPYFERFIEKYPDISALAKSDEEELLKLWQGLGYYSRARNLRKAANECMENFEGSLPDNKKALSSLSGIGDYTAGAIASIAFEEPVSAIDGNVIRVYSRIFTLDQDFSKAKEKKELDRLIRSHIPEGKAGDFNQALMELGALICIPSAPRCQFCPISSFCKACQENVIEKYPVKKQKKARTQEHKKIFVHYAENPFRLRLVKREEAGLLHGLYGFDDTQLEHSEITHDLGFYKHIFTHREWWMDGYMVRVTDPDDSFLTPEQIARFSVPTAFQSFLKKALSYEKQT